MEDKAYTILYETQDKFWWNKGISRLISRTISRCKPGNGNIILDAGCGVGGLFATLARHGTLYGIDYSPLALTYAAKRREAKQVVQGNIEEMPFPDGLFDVVICADVLYHRQVNDRAAIAEFRRVLKEDGRVIIKEIAYEWLKSKHDALMHGRHRYTRGELTRLLEEAGFDVEKSSYCGLFIFPVVLLVRLLEKIGLGISSDSAHTNTPVIGALFKRSLYLEAWLLRYVNLPFGLGIVTVAKPVSSRAESQRGS
jgi:ubiquinone/menaquinone biosynthesis C-methylase UbiE